MTRTALQAETKRTREALLRFAAAMDATADAIYLVDRSRMSFVYLNAAACRLLAKKRDEAMLLEPWTVLLSSRDDLERVYDGMIDGSADNKPTEVMRQRADGSCFWIELRRNAHRVAGRWTIVTLVRNITARRAAESKIIRLNRVYAVLSGINSLVIRVRDRNVLFKEACQIAVGQGRFNMAWIGIPDKKAMKIVPVASAGMSPDFISLIEGRFSSDIDASLDGGGSAARALNDRKPVVRNSILGDTTVLLAQERLEQGINSMVMLPLLVAGEAVGVLGLYSEDAEFFDAQEMKLLEELAGDIAFATDYIAKAEKLAYLAYYDPLTGLPNRVLFHERLEQELLLAREHKRSLALVLLDIERFKSVNETFGWAAGDAVLKEMASRISFNAFNIDRLARIDADHFAFIVSDLQTTAEVTDRIVRRSAEVFAAPLRIADSDVRISAKIGVAVFPADAADGDSLFRNAQAALKTAKDSGERYVFYTSTMNAKVAERFALENDLRRAIDEGQFVLYYQPKVSIESGRLTGAEALIRWNHPETGMIQPGRFIPILEETGLILEVGRWALGQAIEDYLRWHGAGLDPVRVAVNVSPLQLRDRAFVAKIQDAVSGNERAASGLELEITESLIMANVNSSILSLRVIRAMGITIAVDDFGTGFSCLNYLSKLPIDTLKIDRSFVVDMTVGPTGLALVSTIINLAHSLNLKAVAEGVETEQQSGLLRSLKCDEMQGYLISQALPAHSFESKFLVSRSHSP